MFCFLLYVLSMKKVDLIEIDFYALVILMSNFTYKLLSYWFDFLCCSQN